MKESGDNESGGSVKENPGKEAEVVWACDENIGATGRKEGDGKGSIGLQGEKKVLSRRNVLVAECDFYGGTEKVK